MYNFRDSKSSNTTGAYADSYSELEKELFTLTGSNLYGLVMKLKAGYTLQPPEGNFIFTSDENSYCEHCSNNPKNGGSGQCQCTLGLPRFRW